MTTATRYTADDLGLYDSEGRENAAAYASKRIARAVEAGYVVYGNRRLDLSNPADATAASGLIASDVAGRFPGLGANDTTVREEIYRALIGERRRRTLSPEDETVPGWERAKPFEGRPGWGILIESVGLGAQYWVNLGRSYYGPFDSIEAARDELRAEESATADRAAEKAARQRSRDAQYLRLVAGALAHPDDAGAMADATDPTTVETLREIAARLDGKDQA